MLSLQARSTLTSTAPKARSRSGEVAKRNAFSDSCSHTKPLQGGEDTKDDLRLESQVIFRKRATDYRALLRKMTCKDKAPCKPAPPCTNTVSIIHILTCISTVSVYGVYARIDTHRHSIYKCVCVSITYRPT